MILLKGMIPIAVCCCFLMVFLLIFYLRKWMAGCSIFMTLGIRRKTLYYNPRSGNSVLLFVFYCIWEYIWKYPDTVSENRVDSGTGDGDNACTGHRTVISDYGRCTDGIVCGFFDGYARYYAGV